jgi:predicted RND superfamily exporter protein
MQNLDYGILTEQIRSVVDPILSEKQVVASYTGIIPLIYKAQRQLLTDLVLSFLTAFIIVAVVMLFVLRSLPAALLAMVPNLFPVILVFGFMGWLEIPLQIGSVMTASAALGIAVDDTIHFLVWFRRGMASGSSKSQVLQESIDHCASAMIHTTLISCAGLLVFTASNFVPILHFAYLMVLLLATALLGDLILLPAILASRLGRYFHSGKH